MSPTPNSVEKCEFQSTRFGKPIPETLSCTSGACPDACRVPCPSAHVVGMRIQLANPRKPTRPRDPKNEGQLQ